MRRVLPIIVMVGAALSAAACGVGDDTATQRALPPLTQEPSTTTTSTTAPSGTTTTVVPCDDPTPSYAPLPNVPSTPEAATADRFGSTRQISSDCRTDAMRGALSTAT